MTEQQVLYNSVAPLRNVMALSALIDRIQMRSPGLPGMAVFYGKSGYGKTTAAVWNANKVRAYQVQVKSTWTPRKLCSAILADLAIPPARTTADMVDQIAAEMAKTGRPLIIDEADFLTHQNGAMIELVRDLYESSGAAIVLIGEELLPQKLQKWERVHGRMLDWVAAQPVDIKEVDHLAKIYCPDVTPDLEMKQLILEKSRASARYVSVNLDYLREFALTTGVTSITREAWGNRPLFGGDAPSPRRM